jgi:ABC-type transporter Mla MlaB component
MRKSNFLYYMHDGATAFRLELSGDLSLDSVRELEQAWRTASSMIGERCLVVDLSYLASIDDAGRELLDKWHAQGARFVAISSEAQARIQSMIGRPITLLGTTPKAFTWLPFRTSALWLAIFVLLFPPATSAANQCRADFNYGSASELNDSTAYANRDRLGAVTRAELVHNVLDMHFDGLLGNEKPLRNIPVPISANYVLQDVDLAFG